jgi:hypothetical protein
VHLPPRGTDYHVSRHISAIDRRKQIGRTPVEEG